MAEWAEKYRRIEYEITRCKKQLGTLKNAKKNLVMDIWFSVITLAVFIPFFFILAEMIEFIPGVFSYFYVPVLVLFAVFVIGRSIIRLFKKILCLCHHNRKDLPFQYPKPSLVNSNYPTNIPPNYYAEQFCLEWLIEKYNLEINQLKQLRREVEQASEEDCRKLKERLDAIKIYEVIGRAK